MNQRPNVIFIITHDVGPVYGCYGNTDVQSPNIDKLAGQSIRFTGHYCQWPLCGPSRASLFTGCRPTTTGRYDNQPFFGRFRSQAPKDFASLPEQFARSGTRTFGVGWVYHDDVDPPSWTEGHAIPAANDGPVPDWADGWMDGNYLFEWKAPESRELIQRRLEALKNSGMTPGQFQDPAIFRRARGPAVEAADVDDDAYYDGKVARLACEFLQTHPADDRGFFVGVGFVAPHTPFRAPSRYWDLYDREALMLHANREWPSESAEWMAGDSEPAQYYTTDGYTKPWRPDETQLRELLHGHYATISYLDAQVGRILKAAKERPDWENTIVVFTSDHGYSEGQHGYWGKHNMWDASLHVPLLIRPTSAGPGAVGNLNRAVPGAIDRVTEHVDLYPTLCEMAGIPVPAHCEGRSLLPVLANPEAPWKNAALSHRKPMWHDRLQVYDWCNSLRVARYRYTEYLGSSGEIFGRELFDYDADPLERRNHADDGEYRETVAELGRRMAHAVQSAGTPAEPSG